MILLQALLITFTTTWGSCTISGLTYIDPLSIENNLYKTPKPGQDPCNPLYWYPKNIPEHCYKLKDKVPETKRAPIPLPVPVPLPPQPFMFPMPPPYPMFPPFPMPPPYQMPPSYAPPPPMPMPMTMFPSPIPLPYGIPLDPTYPMLPVGGVPGIAYHFPLQQYTPQLQAGMVPGVPGLVTDDGGINILPFSDVYADLLEKHKQKMVRKKIQKVLTDYEYPRLRKHRRGKLFY